MGSTRETGPFDSTLAPARVVNTKLKHPETHPNRFIADQRGRLECWFWPWRPANAWKIEADAVEGGVTISSKISYLNIAPSHQNSCLSPWSTT